MRIIGFDPGLATTGYAVIETNSRVTALDWGVVATKKSESLPQRLAIIAKDVDLLCKKWKPDSAVVESVFFSKNAKTAVAVAHARGAILLTLARRSVKIQELTPLQLKMRITSYGKASKQQVQYMVQKLLGLPAAPKPDDAADALALALCGLPALKHSK